MSSGDFEIGNDFRPYGIDNDPMPSDLETLTTDAEKVQIASLCVMQTYYMNIVATSFMSFVNQDMGSRACRLRQIPLLP